MHTMHVCMPYYIYLFETIFAMEMCDNRLVVCSSGQKVVVVVRLYTYVLNMIPL